jgi:hypothetical protein
MSVVSMSEILEYQVWSEKRLQTCVDDMGFFTGKGQYAQYITKSLTEKVWSKFSIRDSIAEVL